VAVEVEVGVGVQVKVQVYPTLFVQGVFVAVGVLFAEVVGFPGHPMMATDENTAKSDRNTQLLNFINASLMMPPIYLSIIFLKRDLSCFVFETRGLTA